MVTHNISDDLKASALAYHRAPKPGKLAIIATKPLATQHDLALAYTPGVAVACEAIAADPMQAAALTARGNLVGVVTNGSAVLGLGNIGPLAGKPVMEGKAVLFKKFADIDVFDIEIDATTVDRMIDVISALEPTFGGINLEDIKAPECFEVEAALHARLKIPVFHDDQHGTAIIVSAAVKNALYLTGKKIENVKIVTSGAGAAALACLNLLVLLGARRENIWVTDIEGVVYEGRAALMDKWKAVYAQKTPLRTLAEVIDGADVFLGLSAPNVLKPEMAAKMGERPLIMALANPTPEIMPDVALAAKPDALICTGRSDFPNQVNNVLCFPYIFRGALDVGATTINEEMKIAAIDAIAALARETPSEVAATALGHEAPTFGPGSLIPNPFDPRLILRIAPALAEAAMKSGVATRPIADMAHYREHLNAFVFRSGFIMKPIFAKAKSAPKRIVYAEGEDERVLRAVEVVIKEGLARPILIGRPAVIEARVKRYGLAIRLGHDVELVNSQDDPRYRRYVEIYLQAAGRRGVTPDSARTMVRTNATVIAAIMTHAGEADGAICGVEGGYRNHLQHVRDIIGFVPGVNEFAALSLVLTRKGNFFLADTQVRCDPSAEEVAEMAVLAAAHVRRFGLEPKIALVSHSNFGSYDSPSARKMRHATEMLTKSRIDFQVEGEMHADAALDAALRERTFPHSRLTGQANVLIFPNLDSANIAYGSIRALADALPVGPILIGVARPVHVLLPSTTSRGIVNMTAVAVVEAQAEMRTQVAAE